MSISEALQERYESMLLPILREHNAEALSKVWKQGVATEIESLVQFALDTITLNEYSTSKM